MRHLVLGVVAALVAVLISPVSAAAEVTGLRVAFSGTVARTPNDWTIRALVEREEDGKWSPVQNAVVALDFSDKEDGPWTADLRSTGVDGRASWDLWIGARTYYRARVAFNGMQAETALLSADPATVLVDPGLRLDSLGLTATGRLSIEGRAVNAPKGNVVLKHAFPNSTTWRTVKTFPKGRTSFSLRNFAWYQSGRFRLTYAGDGDAGNVLAGVSNTKTKIRWATKITRKFSPKKLRVGAKVKVTGTLKRYNTSGKLVAFPGRKLQVQWRCKGSSRWYSGGWVKTDKKGRFTRTSKTYCDSYWSVVFFGTSDTWAFGAKNVFIDTTGAPLLRTARLTPVQAPPTRVPGSDPRY